MRAVMLDSAMDNIRGDAWRKAARHIADLVHSECREVDQLAKLMTEAAAEFAQVAGMERKSLGDALAAQALLQFANELKTLQDDTCLWSGYTLAQHLVLPG